MEFLALTSTGIEILLADELKQLGAEDIVIKPDGVYFTAELETAYRICLWTRLASRVLLKLHSASSINKEQLYQAAYDLDWVGIFNNTSTFAIDFVGKNNEIRNSQFGALTVKDAVIDKFRANGLDRPNVDKDTPNIRFQARLVKDIVSIYLDFSGRSLSQRGYRVSTGQAPLKENLAAALVIRSGWLNDTSLPLVDPMCGSGTIVIEAASMAAGQAPALQRKVWGFSHWLNQQSDIWSAVYADAKTRSASALANFKGRIYGSDMDLAVLSAAKQNAKQANLDKFIDFTQQDARFIENKFGNKGTILFNPPYGERIGTLPELIAAYSDFGTQIKKVFIGWRLAIFSASAELFSLLKLASFKKYKLNNGPLNCLLALYDISELQASSSQPDSQEQFVDSAFANRLKKNLKILKPWLKNNSIRCYRAYDADIPEYNVAIDLYGDFAVIQEYAAPNSVDEEKAAKRLQEVLYCAPKVLSIPTSNIVVKTRSKQKGSNQYQALDQKKQSFVVKEYQGQFKVNLWDYLDTGLFLDHRETRQIVAKKAKGKSLLNLFAYTGSVSVQAALAGAKSVVTVDMSNTYIQWAKENFALNKLIGSQYQFIQADCLAWLDNNNQLFDVIFVDPPSFSNSKRMDDTFDVQRDHVALLTKVLKSLSPTGELIFTNNKRNFKMDMEQMALLNVSVKNISEQTRDKDFARNKHIHNSWLITRK